jgi:hypothetical protein
VAIGRAVAETGYVVSRNARSLVTQRTRSVVMVPSEPHEKLFEVPGGAARDPGSEEAAGGSGGRTASADVTGVSARAGSSSK